MNYLFAVPTLNFFGAKSLRLEYERDHLKFRPFKAGKFNKAIQRMLALYDWEVNQVQLNLLDSHDTARALWIMGEDKSALRLAVLFQMTMPGAPCIYYGDEIGLAAGDDPLCREAFPWDRKEKWDQELLTFYQQATTLRRRHSVLRTGSYEALYAKKRLFAFRRVLDDAEAIALFNTAASATQVNIELPTGAAPSYRKIWPAVNGLIIKTSQGKLTITIPAREAIVLIA